MEDTSIPLSNVMKQPSETSDSCDHDEIDNSCHYSASCEQRDLKSKEQSAECESSLSQCRETASLIDDLDEDDVNCDTINDTNTNNGVQTDNEVQMFDGTMDPCLNTNPYNLQEGALQCAVPSVNVPSTQTTPAIRPPICSYLLSQSRLLSKSNPSHDWDHVLRSGGKIKTLVAEAIEDVKNKVIAIQHSKYTGSHSKRAREEGNAEQDEQPSSNQRSRVVNVADFTVELAREKTAQVMQLQRQLKDAQAQAAAVQAANASLREETSSGQSRLDRTIEALRIASSNATKARADADAAEATAATLAQTLQNLKTVLTETKRASQILHQEQQELNATVAVAESKFIQKEAELLQAKKEIAMLRDSNATLETTQIQFSKERENFAHQVKQLEDDLEVLKREKQELNTMEKARKDRFDKVEQEWRKTQTLLVEATSGQAAALQSQSALEETIVALQKANEEIHASLKEQQRIARDDKHRLTESLGKVEKEAQRLRIAAEEKEEEIARLKASKEVTEKQVQQLKSRLSSTERSLKEATIVATTTTPMSSNASPDAVTTPMIPNQLSFQLPPLSTTSSVGKKAATSLLSNSTTSVPTITEKENIGVQNGELCCVCYKPSIGIMKVCQCGTKQCHKKAHANCIKFMNTPAGPSVSHPGTPAPKLPIVLCDHNNHHNNHPPPTTTTKLRSIQ